MYSKLSKRIRGNATFVPERASRQPCYRAAVMVDDPIERFCASFERARQTEVFDASRAALATVGRDGKPSVRFVLVKDVGPEGFAFFTHRGSKKGRQMAENAFAALAWHWSSIDEQVRVEGTVVVLDEPASTTYFATRPRGAQIGAWASQQSQVLPTRQALEEAVRQFEKRFDGRDVPLPPHWGGYRIVPSSIEFWHGKPDRLHHRVLYERSDDGWRSMLLSP